MLRRADFLELTAIGLAGVLSYARALTLGFTFDDVSAITRNASVTGAFSLARIFGRDFWGHAFSDPYGPGTYRPLATLTLWIDQHVGRGAPWAFHATNVVLLIAVLFVCDGLLRAWGNPMARSARIACVLLFATLAIHVEVVANATHRTELLAAVFSLVSAWLACTAAPTWRTVAGATAAVACAVLSKESAIALAVLPGFLMWRRSPNKIDAKAAALSAVGVAVVAGYSIARSDRLLQLLHSGDLLLDNPLIGAPWYTRLAGAGEVLTSYLQHTVAPIDLCFDYSYAAIVPGGWGTRAIAGLAMMIAGIVGVVLSWRRYPTLADALIAFAISYSVASHIVVASSALVADRLFFYPSFWLVVVVVLGVQALAGGRKWGTIACFAAGVFGAGQAALTYVGVPTWRDDLSLSGYGVQACPTNFRIRNMRAAAMYSIGEYEEAAWAVMIGTAIINRHPAPVPAGDFSPEWEWLPVQARVGRLGEKIGDARVMRALKEKTRELLVDVYRYPRAAEAMRGWEGG